MTTYRVIWTIDVDAETPNEAARNALRIQRDTDSEATYFVVTDTLDNETVAVDLDVCPDP